MRSLLQMALISAQSHRWRTLRLNDDKTAMCISDGRQTVAGSKDRAGYEAQTSR